MQTTCLIRTALFWDITQRREAVPYRRCCQPVGPIFKGQEIQELLTLENGIDRLSRNVGKSTLRCVTCQKTAELMYIAAEA